MSLIFQSNMMFGAMLSLGCLAVYFAFPGLYYASALKLILFLVGIYGCLLMVQEDLVIGLAATGFCTTFLVYGLQSRWYKHAVFARTAREWRQHLARDAAHITLGDDGKLEPEDRQIFRHVAESWNPKWSDMELERLLENCASLEDLAQRVHEKEWTSGKKKRR